MASLGGSFGSYASKSASVSAPNEFTRLAQVISNNIHKINQNVSQMNSMLTQYGTNSDSMQLRDKLHEVQHYTNQLAKDTNKYMKDLTALPTPSVTSEQRQQRIQRERLVDEFSKALTSFQDAQRQEKVKEKHSSVSANRPPSASYDPFAESNSGGPPAYRDTFADDNASSGRQQVTLQVDATDVDYEIMRERDEALRQLESDITDVNQIFKDLGMLVHEQGDVIDSIEANVETAAASVEEGSEQLRQARRHQSSSRKKKCILITIILVILAVIAIILAITLSQGS